MEKLTPIGFEKSRITGGFWKEYQELFRRVTVDAVYDRFEETGRFEALKFNWKEGMPGKPHIFWESDVTKWIEGAAYFLQEQRDPKLEERIDELVARMERTQGEDGYLNAYFTVVEPKARFTRRTDHELYCAGHLIEGAIAYAKATGKENMLRVAIRYADLIDRVFRIEHSASFDTPGHEEIELALVKLYHYTGEERYLKLAQYFVDTRGKSSRDETYDFADQEHMQSHLPVREQKTAEGHSVRALYLYSGMADLAMETGEEELLLSCKRLFDNIVQKRMYLTGGVGSTCRGESFTFDYDLPEYTAYNETCASIALALFCRRMWLMDADGRYGDVAEQAIYNTVLSGVSLSGNEFYYENPMSADPRRNAFNDLRPAGLREHLPILKRVKVFDCSCCPPNLLRIVGSIGDFLYSVSDRTIYAHCYMESESEVSLGEKKVGLSQQSAYPLEGKILITVKGEGDFTLALRIPGWCRGAKISVNGQEYAFEKVKGFAFLQRNWKNGDQVLLDLPMEVKWIRANPQVIEACGRVAVMRGPFVYCAEGVDNDNRPLKAVRIAAGSAVAVSMQRIGGFSLPVLSMEAFCRKPMEALYTWEPGQEEEFRLKLIPYFAWANRGVTEMTTWFLEKQ